MTSCPASIAMLANSSAIIDQQTACKTLDQVIDFDHLVAQPGAWRNEYLMGFIALLMFP